MSKLLFLVLTFWSLSADADPQLLPLSTFTSVATYTVNGVENEALLFIASADDNKYLKNIQITSGATSISVDRLNDFNDDGSPKSFQIQGNLLVSTSNDDTITKNLTGNMYITTRSQAKDPNFSVFVVKDAHGFSRNAMKSTVVILNTQLQQDNSGGNQPSKVSYVTNLNHSPNTNIYFQWGIPPADQITTNTFFKNPIVLQNDTDTYKVFFDNVEPLQIKLDCWYITSMGPFNVAIASKYVNDLNYDATAVKTTGLIVSSESYQTHVVNFQPDKTRTGTSGFFYSGFMNNNAKVGFYLETANGVQEGSVDGTNESGLARYGSDQAIRLTVNTTTPTPGVFYCQYFTFPGDLYPVTLPVTVPTIQTTTAGQTAVPTTTVFTTTMGSYRIFGLPSLFLLFAGAKLFLASYDENAYLKNIQVQTGGRKISLDQLNDFNDDDGTPKSITIAGDLLITTTNPDSVTTYLNGYLYVTTKLQAEDSTFSVYVIKNSHSISTTGMKSTVAVLNTKLQMNNDPDEPSKTSYVTNINQSVTCTSNGEFQPQTGMR
ncbi:unnamed protein product [Caenorhabditis brenneri]